MNPLLEHTIVHTNEKLSALYKDIPIALIATQCGLLSAHFNFNPTGHFFNYITTGAFSDLPQ